MATKSRDRSHAEKPIDYMETHDVLSAETINWQVSEEADFKTSQGSKIIPTQAVHLPSIHAPGLSSLAASSYQVKPAMSLRV
jgi:hypothetical protein